METKRSIPLNELIRGLDLRIEHGSSDARIRGLCDDSRQVHEGDLFIARPGSESDGLQYIEDAVTHGAAAAVRVEESASLPVLAKRFFGDPSRQLKLIGVTGTNGKTTTSCLILHLLQSFGRRAGMIGTVEVHDGVAKKPAALTTPGLFDLYGQLRRMAENGCEACVLEVSSHALAQQRTAGLTFQVGLFTNLSGDHLDYHTSMDEYADAKAKLFESLPPSAVAVVNRGDPMSNHMLEKCRAKVLSFDESPGADIQIEIKEMTSRATHCRIAEQEVHLPLVGRYNVYNAAAAYAAVSSLGASGHQAVDALEQFPGVPGRMERVSDHEGFEVFVDYAHTDAALENALKSLAEVTEGQLRVLFGCGGDRDSSKRPRMAKVVCAYADEAVITSDNPRMENPQKIIEDILKGVPPNCRGMVHVEPDRKKAIEWIIGKAQAGDVVLLAGKGHEDYQIIGATKHPFDDRIVARQVMNRAMQQG